MELASQLRTLEASQEHRLLTNAPWGLRRGAVKHV